jgi:predicted DNA-binding ribbon-helix-helix protein
VTVAGHRTSLSLEREFWQELVDAAKEDGKSVASIIAEIDRQRQGANLSSAIRVWLLQRLKEAKSPQSVIAVES